MASLYSNVAVAPPNNNAQPVTDWGSLFGAGAGALANYFGTQSATNALTGGEQNAINTQTGIQGQLGGIYTGQRGLGNGADSALFSSLGLGGTPDYSAFMNSPGFQGSLGLGNQAITRAASANGSLYTPNMLNQLGQYDTTYASQNYNNYVGKLLNAAGLGAQGNSGLSSGLIQTGGNISQLQQNQGNANAGGAANTAGIASNLLSRVPWGSVGSGISNYFNGNSGSNSGGIDTTNSGILNGYTNYSPNTSGYDSTTGNYGSLDNSSILGNTSFSNYSLNNGYDSSTGSYGDGSTSGF
jgi:hypothetical protein